nr:hypothetical protein [Tanacetum cinerariifolium]
MRDVQVYRRMMDLHALILNLSLSVINRRSKTSGLENLIDFEEEILDVEVQHNEAIPLSEEEIAIDVVSSECTMSGSGSGGEEVDYGDELRL